jgi:hypothetical protein
MRRLFESVRASRRAAFAVTVLILLLAVAPAAWSRTGTAQQRQVTVGVIEVDDCKRGNWQRYGVFKNQGDCVSYVATAGRNQPSGQTSTTQGPTTTTTTQPAPTTTTIAANRPGSKEDCKRGGWANYGVFKNQGDCVSFVATGGANPPDGA